MKYDLKETNLFVLFKKYPKRCVIFTISTFEQELKSLGLLKRHYGNKFDGKNAKRDLNFNEKSRLDLFLERFEKRLNYVALIIKNLMI